MKLWKVVLLASYLFFHTNAFAQKEKVRNIFSQYIEVQSKIAAKKLYINEFRLNANSLSWNQGLKYQKTETYYYALSHEQKSVLQCLKVRVDSTDYTYTIEYLFDHQGNLLLCQERQNNPQYHYQQLTVYFEKNDMIQLEEDKVIIQSSSIFHSEKIKYILATAQVYWQKFQEVMR
jgi:hypothetical protein